MTQAERKVLQILIDEGPQLNGDLGVKADLAWNSDVFDRLERKGFLKGHPMQITAAGEAAHRGGKGT